MADQVLRVLSLADLRKVKPDFLIGLCRKSIRIALNAHSKALDRDAKQYIATRSCLVLYEIANSASASNPFVHSWLSTLYISCS